MTDLNKRILDAMQANREGDDPARYAPSLEDKGIFGLIMAAFKGPFRYTVMFAIALMFVFAGLSAYCAYEMINAVEAADKIDWLAGVIVAFIVFGLLRLWFFQELNRLYLAREIKRLELQVALLSEKISENLSEGSR